MLLTARDIATFLGHSVLISNSKTDIEIFL